uniref:Leucine-rich repeat receptor-like protein kinase n=1 Tax=Pohlia nutans TaxID=140635 RepID=A0A1P8DYW2_9BRYO|nr:leucine-rich repeat receptor-like protein kinase [Pohlia nutans]
MAHLKFCVAVLLLLFFSPLGTEAQNLTTLYLSSQLDALQGLWAEWNKSTPNTDSNLAGWNSTQEYPCSQGYTVFQPNWRGVQCMLDEYNCNDTTGNRTYECNDYIIGLTLNNASITGNLPAVIGNISTLVTLELTGNPELTGPLPQEIQLASIYTLDLHDNAFNGILPDLPELVTILNVDLSGNEFVGEFHSQIQKWIYLQTLNLARNHFNGSIPTNAFENMTQLVSLDLSANSLTGPLPNLAMCQNLQSLVMSNNSFNGSLPDLKMLTNLYTLKLAYNNLTGNFPLSSFVNTSVDNTLSVLDLSGNQLTGSVTDWNGSDLGFLEELYLDNTGISGTLDITKLIAGGLVQTKLMNASGGLRSLSMMNNDITNVIYAEGSIENITTLLRLQGNPYCQKDADDGTRCFCEQYCKNQGSMSNKKVVLIASVTSTISVLFVIAIVVAAVLYRAQRYKRYLLLQVQQKFEEFDVKPTIFSYNELRVATRDFHVEPDMKLGEGGYGAVYKGIFPNKSMVAVKQLFVKNTKGTDDFLNEVVLITGMKHRNLMNMKGCCLREDQRLLVYEYVDNYDIDQILLRGEHKTSLSWVVRHNICLGVARGLHYLHALASPRIIHRDIKASNILLDHNFEPKIADFGLALLFPDEKSHIMTMHVAGTKGYLAPEYASLGQLSEKVDVFSFGILVLEILSGRQNIDETKPLDEVYLSKWAWKLHGEGKLMDLVDPTLSLQDNEKTEMQRLINIALLCAQNEAEQRPTMAKVVAILQKDTESEVVVLTSGKTQPQFDTMRLLAFGNNSELTTVKEEDDEPLSSFNARSPKPASSSSSSGHDLTTKSVLKLSEIRAR